MKIIRISDEIYKFLMNLANEVKTQDNRATRTPYFFKVQEDIELAVPNGCGEEVWVMDGEVCLRTEEDIKEAVYEYKNWDIENNEHQTEYNKLGSFDIKEILEKNYRKANVEIGHKYSNCFFTYKAYQEHIKRNGHNLSNPKSYLDHAYRNQEMDMLFKFFEEVSNQADI